MRQLVRRPALSGKRRSRPERGQKPPRLIGALQPRASLESAILNGMSGARPPARPPQGVALQGEGAASSAHPRDGHSERSEESACRSRPQSNCRPFAALRVTACGFSQTSDSPSADGPAPPAALVIPAHAGIHVRHRSFPRTLSPCKRGARIHARPRSFPRTLSPCKRGAGIHAIPPPFPRLVPGTRKSRPD